METTYTYCVTFGQISPFRNGWVEIEVLREKDPAEAYDMAKEEADEVLGRWSNMYEKKDFTPENFPAGKIGETIITH